jgi:NAD+ diphosphatase
MQTITLGFSLFCGPDLILPPGWKDEVAGLPLFESLSLQDDAAPIKKDGLPSGFAGTAFDFGGKSYMAAELSDEQVSMLQGASQVPLRQFIGAAPQDSVTFILKARAYAHWSFVARYCAFCGAPLVDGRGRDFERAKVCGACGRAYFPRISPAVIVLVNRGGEMLLAHNAKFPAGRHGLIAGFVEPGETLEETVHREVMEEAGIEISEPRYVRSQPWPFPDSLMIAFEAEYKSGKLRPDGEEIDHLGWFPPDRLPDIPPRGSVARYLIDRFIDAAGS